MRPAGYSFFRSSSVKSYSWRIALIFWLARVNFCTPRPSTPQAHTAVDGQDAAKGGEHDPAAAVGPQAGDFHQRAVAAHLLLGHAVLLLKGGGAPAPPPPVVVVRMQAILAESRAARKDDAAFRNAADGLRRAPWRRCVPDYAFLSVS